MMLVKENVFKYKEKTSITVQICPVVICRACCLDMNNRKISFTMILTNSFSKVQHH